MHPKTRNGVIITLVTALLAEKIMAKLPGPVWFTGVFIIVYVVARVCFPREGSVVAAYFEDVFLGLLLCVGIGIMAWYLDGQISIYTGKSGSPAIPAFVFAVITTLTFNTHW